MVPERAVCTGASSVRSLEETLRWGMLQVVGSGLGVFSIQGSASAAASCFTRSGT